jgi:radical SAM superfamily enzyme YgiQ (UPF0313 family)
MSENPRRCLFVSPKFSSQSFWNYRATCELTRAKYPAAPLGLITVAALLPSTWECRLVDTNAQELDPQDVEWADLVFLGGMISQQPDHLRLIERFRALGKTVISGGPDPTSSPHLYAKAHHLVLGEAEVTLPEFLADLEAGNAKHAYEAGDRKADMAQSPVPRYDLLTFHRYLQVGIQWNRGCPFNCEFCDIIELFGRVPRGKNPGQILAELDRLYDLGYRGHIDIVDDNFIGNKKAVKALLPEIIDWSHRHGWPFEFSTEASLNLADDEELMTLMQRAGFAWLFVGIETPDETTLRATQKLQNTKRSIPQSVRKIVRHGMIVNSGYIVGFDEETHSVAQAILDNIEATAIPINMVGMLFALPNTQLTRRLQREGRLDKDFEVPPDETACQCVSGLNFRTKRPRRDILMDYRRVVSEAFAPASFFHRVRETTKMLDCSKRRLRIPLKNTLKDLRAFGRMIAILGFPRETRREFWRSFASALLSNPRAIRYSMSIMALYIHFGAFRHYVLGRLDQELASLENHKETA